MSTHKNCKACEVSFKPDHHANLYCQDCRSKRGAKKTAAPKKRRRRKAKKVTKRARKEKQERTPAERWWGAGCDACHKPWFGSDHCIACEADQTHRIGT